MKVSLTDAGKRFNRDWIFRHLTHNFESGISYAITGPNGSGKSTLLQVLSGSMQLSEGNGAWSVNDNIVPAERINEQVSICAPYLEVIEEMNLSEFLKFHHHFKPLKSSISIEAIISIIGLKDAANKQIRYYSSGMKQRVKMAQAFFSNTPFLLLDEPCTNLDSPGIELYNQLIESYCKDRLVIVSSNDEIEYRFCKQKINILDFKK